MKGELVSLTPEGKIVLTLKHGKHSYSELKLETELSDRWLTTKLEELRARGVVKKTGRWYVLRAEVEASTCELSLYMRYLAKRMASELAKLPFIRTIFLFGSVAQNNAHEYSDLDTIIVVNEPVDRVKGRIISEISRLESSYHVTVEPLILTVEDFLDNVHSEEGGIIYGIAEGYEVLVDKTREFSNILYNRVMEIRHSHDYLKEARIWLKVK